MDARTPQPVGMREQCVEAFLEGDPTHTLRMRVASPKYTRVWSRHMTSSNPPVPRTVDDQLVSFPHNHLDLGTESILGTTHLTGAGDRA
ncbi:hypothetical protein A5732_22160 [Mycobacterium colombiense]|nr:hypothetical protein A5732_22160 [Mycobacterium colombiense]